MRRVTAEGVAIVAIGIVAGVTCAFGASRFTAPLLYRTSLTEFDVVASVTIALLVIAVLASAAPAWRAARVDPNVALREE